MESQDNSGLGDGHRRPPDTCMGHRDGGTLMLGGERGSRLMGSVARDTASPESDVDLGVLLRSRPAATLEGRLFGYEADLERAVGRAVQVVILNDAPPDLAYRVLLDGRLVLDRDRAARLRFEVRTRNLYFDLLPTLAHYRRRAREIAATTS
jgi:uncharacterized protein